MAINQILQFGGSAGSNVLSPTDYAALAARSIGFQSGVAKSKEVNTPLRQSAFVASMIGQFIANKAGVDVLDDGDVAGLVADFLLALNAQVQSRVATTAQAQAKTDDSVLLTPKKLDDAFLGANQLISGASGAQVLPGGYILQGFTVTSGNGSFSFPMAFPNGCFSVVGVESAATGTIYAYVPMFSGVTRFGAQTSFRNLDGTLAPSSGMSIKCWAFGR